jgi:hypothetical protein
MDPLGHEPLIRSFERHPSLRSRPTSPRWRAGSSASMTGSWSTATDDPPSPWSAPTTSRRWRGRSTILQDDERMESLRTWGIGPASWWRSRSPQKGCGTSANSPASSATRRSRQCLGPSPSTRDGVGKSLVGELTGVYSALVRRLGAPWGPWEDVARTVDVRRGPRLRMIPLRNAPVVWVRLLAGQLDGLERVGPPAPDVRCWVVSQPAPAGAGCPSAGWGGPAAGWARYRCSRRCRRLRRCR